MTKSSIQNEIAAQNCNKSFAMKYYVIGAFVSSRKKISAINFLDKMIRLRTNFWKFFVKSQYVIGKDAKLFIIQALNRRNSSVWDNKIIIKRKIVLTFLPFVIWHNKCQSLCSFHQCTAIGMFEVDFIQRLMRAMRVRCSAY